MLRKELVSFTANRFEDGSEQLRALFHFYTILELSIIKPPKVTIFSVDPMATILLNYLSQRAFHGAQRQLKLAPAFFVIFQTSAFGGLNTMVDSKLEEGIAAGSDAIENARKAGRDALENGYESVREYGEKSLEYASQAGEGLLDFVKREPLLAVAGAFLVGYVAAQIIRRISA